MKHKNPNRARLHLSIVRIDGTPRSEPFDLAREREIAAACERIFDEMVPKVRRHYADVSARQPLIISLYVLAGPSGDIIHPPLPWEVQAQEDTP